MLQLLKTTLDYNIMQIYKITLKLQTIKGQKFGLPSPKDQFLRCKDR